MTVDCRNNIDNCILEPLYDEIGEICIKKFCTIFSNETYRGFFSPSVMREEMCHENMENDKKLLQKAKNILKNTKIDPNSILFSGEKIDNILIKKLKKSKYPKDSLLLKLIGLVEQSIDNEEKIPTRVDYVEKRETDRLILYSFDGPFQSIHAEVGNLEFFGKSATTLKYVLLAADLYSSKVYVYPMHSRKQILQKIKQFYENIKNKRNMQKTMCLQVDNELPQVKIKDLNDEDNIEMFTSSVRSGKAFAAEQKIQELKSRIAKLNALKMKSLLQK